MREGTEMFYPRRAGSESGRQNLANNGPGRACCSASSSSAAARSSW